MICIAFLCPSKTARYGGPPRSEITSARQQEPYPSQPGGLWMLAQDHRYSDFLSGKPYQRRVGRMLNKGELVHSLAHLSPILSGHINLHGSHHFDLQAPKKRQGHLPPLPHLRFWGSAL